MLIDQLSKSVANVTTRCGVNIFLLFSSKLPRHLEKQLCSLSKGNDGIRRQFPFGDTRKLRSIYCGSCRVDRRLLEDWTPMICHSGLACKFLHGVGPNDRIQVVLCLFLNVIRVTLTTQ